MSIADKIKRLLCRHNYEKISWYAEYDELRHERFAVRTYRCSKCGKKIKIDGRYDPYF